MLPAVEARSRRDSGLTALILGFFAMAWFGWGQAGASGALSAALAVGSAASLVVALLGALRAFRRPRTEGALHDPAAGRRYGILVGIEFALSGLGAGVLGATGRAASIPVWVCAVVGLHFFPLAAVLGDPALRWLGAALTAVAVAALLAGLFTGVPPSSVTGAGAGVALLAYATLALPGARRQDVAG